MLPNDLLNNMDSLRGRLTGRSGGVFWPLLRGVLGAALVIIAGSLLLALVFCFSSLSSQTMHLLQLPLLGLAALVGAFIAAKAAGRKGLAQGVRLAVLLLVLLAVLTLAGGGQITVAAVLVKGLIVLICGAVGGMLGVF